MRDVIKITKWQKQDVREGFKETFKPLIKSQDSIKKSIDEQQNATIAQLKANQLALTSGLEKINETNLRLAEMRELPALEGGYEEPTTSKAKSPTRYNIEKNLEQVRDVIKITKWQKQDVREGFKETFKPLIKSQDSIKKSIDEQQNATIAFF